MNHNTRWTLGIVASILLLVWVMFFWVEISTKGMWYSLPQFMTVFVISALPIFYCVGKIR